MSVDDFPTFVPTLDHEGDTRERPEDHIHVISGEKPFWHSHPHKHLFKVEPNIGHAGDIAAHNHTHPTVTITKTSDRST